MQWHGNAVLIGNPDSVFRCHWITLVLALNAGGAVLHGILLNIKPFTGGGAYHGARHGGRGFGYVSRPTVRPLGTLLWVVGCSGVAKKSEVTIQTSVRPISEYRTENRLKHTCTVAALNFMLAAARTSANNLCECDVGHVSYPQRNDDSRLEGSTYGETITPPTATQAIRRATVMFADVRQ